MPNLDHRQNHQNHREYHQRAVRQPSFSSILLEAISRSIDIDSSSNQHDLTTFTSARTTTSTSTTTTTRFFSDSNQSNDRKNTINYEADAIDLRRALMLEKWTERHQSQNNNHKARIIGSESVPDTAWSSPSDSSRGGDNSSSSETDLSSSSCFTPRIKPRKIRTSIDSTSNNNNNNNHSDQTPPPSRFTATKLKIYAELKRLHQQPNSPGARIAGFLNSIFHPNKQTVALSSDLKSNSSTPQSSESSSASSSSRSCLTKHHPPSSVKKSVRFDDGGGRRPCANPNGANSKPRAIARRQRDGVPSISRSEEEEIDEAIRAMMMMRGEWPRRDCGSGGGGDGGGEAEDDAKSYASSDLFELENVGSMGFRYGEELPVFGTTSFRTVR